VKNQYGFKCAYVVINGFWGMIGHFRDFRDIVPFQVQPHNDVFMRDAASRIKDGARSWYDDVVFVLKAADQLRYSGSADLEDPLQLLL
jgi:hypothetical protein